jgi:hypothetical protein
MILFTYISTPYQSTISLLPTSAKLQLFSYFLLSPIAIWFCSPPLTKTPVVKATNDQIVGKPKSQLSFLFLLGGSAAFVGSLTASCMPCSCISRQSLSQFSS